MIHINLLNAPSNIDLEVMEIDAGMAAKKRLISMGIHTGDRLVKHSNSSWGPVLVQNVTLNATKIAIGKRLASKIKVAYPDE